MLVCIAGVLVTQAQNADNGFSKADRAYSYFVNGQGDSLYAVSSQEMQAAVSSQTLSMMFQQLEGQCGKLKGVGQWTVENKTEYESFVRRMDFEHVALNIILSFKGDTVVGIFFRPVQEPKPVRQLAENERNIKIVTGEFELDGVLTLPVGGEGGKVPCAVLVHGSGAQDMDETIGQCKPFRDLAEGLSRRGIAVVRYDKRTLKYQKFVPEGREMDYDAETVDDAVSAVALAKTFPKIDTSRIFVIGHSLGAMLAPRIASRSQDVAGIIMLAAPARPLADILPEQVKRMIENGADSALITRNVEMIKNAAPQSYWDFDRNYSPLQTARSLSLPMLILQGERDIQVTMSDFDMWKKAFSGKKNVTLKSYPTLGHIFTESDGKYHADEYSQPMSLADEVVNDIALYIIRW